MHIPEHYLSPETGIAMMAVMAPIWYRSVKEVKVKLQEDTELSPLLGIGSSLSFLVMMFNLPIPGGTTAHVVGAAILAILFNPWVACLMVSVALAIQAFLFGDGGILALGANCFTMAFIMPFSAYYVYQALEKWNKYVGAFLAGFISLNLAALMVAVLLGIQPLLFKDASGAPLYNPYPLSITVPTMGAIHLLVGLVEGAFTAAMLSFMAPFKRTQAQKKPASPMAFFKVLIPLLIVFSPLGLIATGDAWGEWGFEDLPEVLASYKMNTAVPKGMENGFTFNALFPDYSIPGLPEVAGYILSAITAVLLFLIIFKLVFRKKTA